MKLFSKELETIAKEIQAEGTAEDIDYLLRMEQALLSFEEDVEAAVLDDCTAETFWVRACPVDIHHGAAARAQRIVSGLLQEFGYQYHQAAINHVFGVVMDKLRENGVVGGRSRKEVA